ncbi:MAG: PEP-CTERM sorting domain-containing protein [Terracidiphilus sp.]|jgi:hypothetical protein
MRYLASILAAALLCLGASTAKADSVVIDFSWYGNYYGPGYGGVVSFTGTPEANGNINMADLTAFSLTDNSGQSFGLGQLDGFGTYNSSTETWSANALDWYGDPDAFVTANYLGFPNSWSLAEVYFEAPITYTVVSDTGGTAVTPEPGTLFLLGSGMIGLVGLISLGKTRQFGTPTIA